MQDIFRMNICDGGQIFEHQGRVYARYNASLKVAGDSVKVCFYQKGILQGFPKNKLKAQTQEDSGNEPKKNEYDPEKRWERTGLVARRRLYDFVAANLKRHTDHNGKKQSFKLFTATFREDIKDLNIANKMFSEFMARLNYHFTGEKGAAFIEYVAVPELQMENNRYVWHYHIVFFNMPYIPVSSEIVEKQIAEGSLPADYDKRDTLFYIWGNGTVKVNKVKFSDSFDIAGYICKYIGKGLNDLYEYACEKGNLHRKRFLRSSGLCGPKMMIAFLNRQQRQELYDYFKKHAKRFKKRGDIGTYFETFNVDNEFIGKLFGINFRSAQKHITGLENLFVKFGYGFN